MSFIFCKLTRGVFLCSTDTPRLPLGRCDINVKSSNQAWLLYCYNVAITPKVESILLNASCMFFECIIYSFLPLMTHMKIICVVCSRFTRWWPDEARPLIDGGQMQAVSTKHQVRCADRHKNSRFGSWFLLLFFFPLVS